MEGWGGKECVWSVRGESSSGALQGDAQTHIPGHVAQTTNHTAAIVARLNLLHQNKQRDMMSEHGFPPN